MSRRSSTLIIALTVVTVAMAGVAVVVALSSGKHTKGSEAAARPTQSGNPISSSLAPTTTTTIRLSPLQVRVVAVTQKLATALANRDWPAARLNPVFEGRSDASFRDSFRNLQQSTVVLARTRTIGGSRVDAHVGLVAWEDPQTGPQTSVYCVTWTVDLRSGRVVGSGAFTNLTTKSLPGYVDANAEAGLIRSGC